MTLGGFGGLRHLPVYFVVDCATVPGQPPLDLQWLATLAQHLTNDPQSRESAEISLIFFTDVAQQYPFVPVDMFVLPAAPNGHQHSLGAALRALTESLQHDLRTTAGGRRADYRPLVFIVLRGQPTDNYATSLAEVQILSGRQAPRLLVVGQTGQVAPEILRAITPNAYVLDDFTPESLQRLIKIASNSIVVASRGIAGTVKPPRWLQDGPLHALE